MCHNAILGGGAIHCARAAGGQHDELLYVIPNNPQSLRSQDIGLYNKMLF